MSAEEEQEEQQSQPCRRWEKNKQLRTRQQTKRGAGPLPRGGSAGSQRMQGLATRHPRGWGQAARGAGATGGAGPGCRVPVCASPLRVSLSGSAKEREHVTVTQGRWVAVQITLRLGLHLRFRPG